MENGISGGVTVIVPALNAEALLPDCLGAIRESNHGIAEIVLFDDGSSDATGLVAASYGARVIRNDGDPLGPGEGRNRAAAASGTEYLIFVDADVVIHRDAISRLGEAISEPGVVAAFGSYDDRPPARKTAALYVNLRHHFVHQTGPRYASTFWAGLGMVRRDAFTAAGGFDPSFNRPSIEDIELGGRIIAQGGRIRIVPAAQGTHLKAWRLLQLWRTDIFQRAIPWSFMIAEKRSAGTDLNAGVSERIAAILAHIVLLSLILSLWMPWALVAGAAVFTAYCVKNRRFFALLASRLPPAGLAAAVALHWIYHLYASLIFLSVSLLVRLRRGIHTGNFLSSRSADSA